MRTVDKTKKSNIKCEHCKHWDKDKGKCNSKTSLKYGKETHYWNRCKAFSWN